MVEHCLAKAAVAGSSPVFRSKIKKAHNRLMKLVVCFVLPKMMQIAKAIKWLKQLKKCCRDFNICIKNIDISNNFDVL